MPHQACLGIGGNMQMCDRREALILAAADLFLHKGYAKTGIRDITNKAGVTRSLFYHYFADKDAITNAVIDRKVDDFMAFVREWTSHLQGDDIHSTIVELAGIMRTVLLAPLSIGGLVIREQSAELYHRFVVRSSQNVAEHFVRTRDEQGALIHLTNTQHPRESFYVLSVGIMSLVLRNPEVSDELIADLIIDTLHIDA